MVSKIEANGGRQKVWKQVRGQRGASVILGRGVKAASSPLQRQVEAKGFF